MKIILLLIGVVSLLYLSVYNASIYAQTPPNTTEDRLPQRIDDNTLRDIIDIIRVLFPKGEFSSDDQTTGTTTPSPSQQEPAQAIRSFRALFGEIEERIAIPQRILEAVLIVENPSIIANYTEQDIDTYSRPGASIPNCRVNSCSAAGPMQFTTGVDDAGSTTCSQCCSGGKCLNRCPNAWAGYSDSVNSKGGYAHQSNVCNLRDNIYAAGAKIKNDSGNRGGAWTEAQVHRAIERYYGACDNNHRYARLGGRTYCEFVWWYYTSGQ